MGQCVSRPEPANEAVEVPLVVAKGPSLVQEQPQSQAKDVNEPSPNPGLPYKASLLGPPPPPCEDDRLATLKALKLNGMTVEAPPDPEIENILKLVASIFQAPSALVALFDDKKIFIRETQGGFTRGDFPWRWSFCAWTMAAQQDQIMVIPDATKDVRFAENINVTCEGGVRFYCGAPLIASNGHRLGTLCFADTKPREFDSMQASILGNFAEMVVRHVEKDIALQLMSCDNEALSHAYKNLKRTIDCFEHCVVLLDTSQPGWKVMHTNAAWEKATGCRREGIQGVSLADVMEALSGPLPSRQHQEAVTAGKTFTVEGARVKTSWLAAHAAGSGNRRSVEATSSGSRSSNSRSRSRRLVLKLRPAGSAPLDEDTLALAVPSWVANAKISDQSGAAGAPLYFMTIESAEAVKGQMLNHPSRSLSSPVQGLQLGQLLGSGSFGSVYAGHWFGTPVAIKVIDQDLKALEAAGAQVEAVLGSELRHPHIVATLTYAVHGNPNPSSGTVSAIFSDDTAQDRSGSLPHGSRPSSASKSRSTPPPKPTTNTRAAPMADSVQSLAAFAAVAASNVHVEVSDSGSGSALRPGSALSGATSPDALAGGVGSSGAVEISSARHSSQGNSVPTNALFSVMEVPADSQVGFLSGGGIGMSEFGSCTGLQAEIGMGLSVPQHVAHNIGNRQQTWIVLEFCDKGTLQDAVDRGWLRKPGSSVMNMTAVISTACEVASALLYLHSHGVVHGDLSAWNVLLTTSGAAAMAGGRGFIAKVADFGLSRSLDIKTRIQTRTYGTITHQPPETLLEGLVSRETDTYSLGVLLWQMYTGSRPWGGMTHAQIIMAVASGSARLTFPPDAPHEFAALAMACMAFDAAERPSMAAVCTTLECMKSSRHSIDLASSR